MFDIIGFIYVTLAHTHTYVDMCVAEYKNINLYIILSH